MPSTLIKTDNEKNKNKKFILKFESDLCRKIYNELCLFQSIWQLSDFSSDFLQIGVSDMKLNIVDIISDIELCKYDVLSIQKTFYF